MYPADAGFLRDKTVLLDTVGKEGPHPQLNQFLKTNILTDIPR
jgi:hypothetical protein